MRTLTVIAGAALAVALWSPELNARPVENVIHCDLRGCRGDPAEPSHKRPEARGHRDRVVALKTHGRPDLRVSDPRPPEWCAWWLRRYLHIPREAFRPWRWNLASGFREIGEAVAGPAAGVIAVWPGHVGLIRGGCDGKGCVVLSGNDSHRVRERYRSLRGVISYRRWTGGVSLAQWSKL